jgi:serine/threonine protein kinase
MRKLSKLSGLYPQCFSLEHVNLCGDVPLAAGSFTDIYKANHNGHAVCIKVIRLYETPRVDYVLKVGLNLTSSRIHVFNSYNLQRLYQETSLWGKLSHPNLLPFYGQFRFRAQLSLVSPWMKNGDINDYLKNNSRVDRVCLVRKYLACK